MQWTLERLVPQWQHRETHHRLIHADPEHVWDTLWDLRVRELTVTDALMRLRGGPRTWLRGTAANGDLRVMDAVAPQLLVADRPTELVLTDVARYAALRPARPERKTWTPQDFADFADPGWTKVAMNFRLTPVAGGTDLSTETRVFSTDALTRQMFALYWVAVRVGSGMVRHDVLHAVARAATSAVPST